MQVSHIKGLLSEAPLYVAYNERGTSVNLYMGMSRW